MRWLEAHAGEAGAAAVLLADGDFVDGQQRALFSVVNSYRDVLLPTHAYPERCELFSFGPKR